MSGGVSRGAAVMPALALGHGPGPAYILPPGTHPMMVEAAAGTKTPKFLGSVVKSVLPRPPRAIVVVSAHWEGGKRGIGSGKVAGVEARRVAEAMVEAEGEMGVGGGMGGGAVSVGVDLEHSLYYDYYGFPKEAYEVDFAAKGDEAVAAEVVSCLTSHGFEVTRVTGRGLDHGVFVPLRAMLGPSPTVPIIPISLDPSLATLTHINLGHALRPLREKDILVIGSGSPTHSFADMGRPGAAPDPWAMEFERWLFATVESAKSSPAKTLSALQRWTTEAPHAKRAHPTPEHFLPLLVAVTAGLNGHNGEEPATVAKRINQQWALGNLALHSYLVG